MDTSFRKNFFQRAGFGTTIIFMLVHLLLSSSAVAQTGVSNDRVSLPEGPGSLEGIGDDISFTYNMGTMGYNVPITLPDGFTSMVPQLGISYNSGGGGSIVGMGWSINTPNIERLTLRGCPVYNEEDEIQANGALLVLVETDGDTQIYRERFEGSFVRYTWYGAGNEGYWIAEYPDGRIGYFGADSDGTIVDSARVGGDDGIFRYLLVEMVDVWGHQMKHTYEQSGSTSLTQNIGWVYTDGENPDYEVVFEYESRQDLLSDATGGFEEVTDQRVSAILVYAHGTVIRNYELSYEDYDTSGGFSRLASVVRFGIDSSPYPISYNFEYSRSLGDLCDDEVDCTLPYIVNMGSLGVNMQSGDAALVDINGDALPDVITSKEEGLAHLIFLNKYETQTEHYFDAPYDSAVGNQGSHDFSSPYVQPIDANGDGFTDVISSNTGMVLINEGNGDWEEMLSLWGDSTGLPDLGDDFNFEDGEMNTLRFFDYNNDKYIDMIRSLGAGNDNQTSVFQNSGSFGFTPDPDVEELGAGFDSDTLQLNDMNGDGMLDAVQVMETQVRYRINLGWGRWTEWRIVGDFSFTDQEKKEAELEDINGDAIADLVLVYGDTVQYWVNRNGAHFDPVRVITSNDINGDIPERDSETTVLFADMNGNGSSDVVWITSGGDVTYLELYPVRPNLISRIENGIGLVMDITYGTTVEHMARDGGSDSWAYRIPFPMIVVDRSDTWDRLTNVHRVTTYNYHDGYYDGIEKSFRGYEVVEENLESDESQESGVVYRRFDIGVSDPYYNGVTIYEEVESGGVSLMAGISEYGDCPVEGIPEDGLRFDVRHICSLWKESEFREGAPESEWVKTRIEYTYDGYGNVTTTADLGVISVGDSGCEPCTHEENEYGQPCGSDCLGDELYTVAEFIEPESDGRWVLKSPFRERIYGELDSDDFAETLTYYDGPDFVGLSLGEQDRGSSTRVENKTTHDGHYVSTIRTRVDDHGNTVEELTPFGEPGGDDYRTVIEYDDAGLRVTAVENFLKKDDQPYSLRIEYRYDLTFDQVIHSTNFFTVIDGETVSPVAATSYLYDAQNRVNAIIKPGDTDSKPTVMFEYFPESTHFRIVTSERTVSGGEVDAKKITCFDGRGRVFQTKDSLGDGTYRVDGFTVHN